MADIVVFASMTDSLVIGQENCIPWFQENPLIDNKELVAFRSEYWNRFDRLVDGSQVILGRGAYFSLKNYLTGRKKVVLSRLAKSSADSTVEMLPSLEFALEKYYKEDMLCIMGGETIFEQAVDQADRLEITYLHVFYQGERKFPDINPSVWKLRKVDSRKIHSNYTYERF
jgi:dihydrofolate reductase